MKSDESGIGKIIRAKREAMHLTQEALAGILAVTPQAVSRWENDISYPDIPMLLSLADTFQITVDELLGRIHEPSFYPPEHAPLSQNQVDAIFEDIPVLPDIRPGKTIFYLDDVGFIRTAVMELLQNNGGHQTYPCAESRELFDLLDSGKLTPDCILLDIGLSGEENGLDILERIKKIRPELKVVMLSARSYPENAKKAHDLGAAGFVVKPFQPSCLLEKI